MAEPIIYKFGEKDLDLDHYIYNLGTNVQDYLEHTNWSDAQKEEFINSYNKYIQGLKDQLSQNSSRFSTDSFGTIIDTTGEFNDKDTVTDYYDNFGNKITAEEYNNLKDKKKKKYSQFNANRKVAQYFNLVGKKLSEYKKEEAEKFDLAKHGFINTWGYSVDPTGNPDLQIYLNKDILDEKTGKRGRTERAKYLAEQLKIYRDNLKDYDFTDSTVGNKEDYIKKLDVAITELENGTFDNNDAEALQAVGIDRDFRNKFFSEFDTVSQTEDDWKANKETERKQQEAKAAEEEATTLNDDWETYYIDRYNRFNKRQQGRLILHRLSKPLNDSEWDKITADGDLTHLNLDELYKKLYQAQKFSDTKTIQKVLSAAIRGGLMTEITEGVHKGKFYLTPPDGFENFETTNYASMVYNPNDNTVQAVFSGEIPKYTRQMQENFLKLKGKIPNRNFSVPPLLSYNKEGGVIEKFQHGKSLNSFVRNEYETVSKERAEKAGKTTEQYKEGQRKLSQDFDADDIAELSAIGLDIASIISSFIPGAGTAVSLGTGLASTAASTYANWDNQGFWENMGDLTANVGLDLAGLIPGVGAAAKIHKLVKPLAKWGPKVLGLAAAGSLALDNNAAQAWKKVKNQQFSDLTADDLKAIGETLSIIAGGTSYYRNNKNAKAARKYIEKYQVNNPEKFNIKTKEGIDVEVDKDTYEAIQNAPDLEKANELLNAYKKNKSSNETEEVVNILTTTKGRKKKEVVSKKAFQHTPADYLKRPELKKLTWNPKTWGDNNLNNHILRWNTYGMPVRDPKENRAVRNLFESHKQGGRLSFSKVRRFKSGGINDVEVVEPNKYDWYNIMVNDRFRNYLDKQMKRFQTKQEFVDWFNKNQDDWYANLQSTGYTRGGQAKQGINNNVGKRQEWFNTTGLNANIEDAVTNGIIRRRGKTGDNLEGHYIDNWFGSQEYLRHFGTAKALSDKSKELSDLKKWFKEKGFTYDAANNGMMHVGIFDSNMSETEEKGKPAAGVEGGGKEPGKTNPEEETNLLDKNKQTFRDRLGKIFGNTFLTHDIPRAFVADKFNKKMADLYKQDPILQNPFEFHRYVKSNLPAEMTGQHLAGQYRNLGNRATTSDGSLYVAQQLGAETKAKEAILQGLMQSDQALQTSSEAAWAQEKENAKLRHATAQNNKVVLNQTAENNDKIKASLLSQKGEIIKNLIAKHQYNIETEKAKKDGIREQFALQEIEDYAKTKILEGNTLSQAEKDAFIKVESGTRPSDLKPDELNAYNSAYKKLSKFKWGELKKYYEIGNTPWYLQPTSISDRINESKKPKTSKRKKGGILKARTADAERFQKLIIETMKKNERMLDRVSKSMFKFTKDWIVK